MYSNWSLNFQYITDVNHCLGSYHYLRVIIGSKSLVCVATSEAQTCPICISRDIISSYSGGKAWQNETKQGRVGMKKAKRFDWVKTGNGKREMFKRADY